MPAVDHIFYQKTNDIGIGEAMKSTVVKHIYLFTKVT